jgi:outer membrane receptor protein involved in Fe transport
MKLLPVLPVCTLERRGLARKGLGAAAGLAAGLLASGLGSAYAQQAAGQSLVVAQADTAGHAVPPGKSVIEDVVVTAEKRSSTVQNAPLSITALSGAQLQRQGITTVMQVAESTPGISLRSAGPGQTELEMRGMSSSGGSSPTVGFYLDETPLTPPAASLNGKVVIDPDLFDLNRVEVLRGPQGTLYGAGSMGGTIKLLTNQPNLNEFQGTIDTTISGTVHGSANPTGKAMLNIPIVNDKAALRIVGEEKYVSGWIDRIVDSPFPFPTNPNPSCGAYQFIGCSRGNVQNVASQQTIPAVNWEWQQSARAALLLKPTDDLTIDTSLMYQRITMGGYNEYDLPPGATVLAHYQPFNINEPFSDTFKLASGTINYDLGFATLTSATSYWSRNEVQSQDASEAVYSLLNSFGLPDTAFQPIVFTEQDQSNQFSEELRIASQGDTRLTWVGGVFYSKLESIFHDTNQSPDVAYLSVGGAAANPQGAVYDSDNPYHVDQYAVFGEASYRILPQLKATVGLRYFSYSTRVSEEQAGIGTFSGNGTPTYANFSTSASGVTPKFNVSYQPDADLNVYATAAKGFRPGGVNLPIPTSIGCTLTNEIYQPDTSWDYELGEKARLFDNRLQVNGDVYYISWSNVQQLINQTCGYPLTQNAGNAESYGPELEITAKLTPELTLSFSGAYTHATLTTVNATLTKADAALVPGTPILNIPKYTESTSLTYRRPFNDDYQFMARISNSYVGPSTDISFGYVPLAPYDLVNFRTGLEGSHWSGYFFIDNLTNKHAELSVNTTSFSWVIPSLTRVATNLPLTAGVNLAYKF